MELCKKFLWGMTKRKKNVTKNIFEVEYQSSQKDTYRSDPDFCLIILIKLKICNNKHNDVAANIWEYTSMFQFH